MGQNVLNWVQMGPTGSRLKMSPFSEPESSPACNSHFFRAQAKLSSDVQNLFEPEPCKACILSLLLSLAEPDQLIFCVRARSVHSAIREYIFCGQCTLYNVAIKCLPGYIIFSARMFKKPLEVQLSSRLAKAHQKEILKSCLVNTPPPPILNFFLSQFQESFQNSVINI